MPLGEAEEVLASVLDHTLPFLPVLFRSRNRDGYNKGMQPMNIELPPDLLERLQRVAAEREMPVAAAVREATGPRRAGWIRS